MSDMSENEILQAASVAKKVMEAQYGLLNAIDQKTGFEQKAADAAARYQAADAQCVAKQAELEALQKKLDMVGEDYEAAKAYADKIIDDAQTQADNTRILAQNDAGLTLQRAQDQAAQILHELAGEQSRLEGIVTEKQTQCDALDDDIKAKTAELSRVQGDLEAAKDQIRRKFFN